MSEQVDVDGKCATMATTRRQCDAVDRRRVATRVIGHIDRIRSMADLVTPRQTTDEPPDPERPADRHQRPPRGSCGAGGGAAGAPATGSLRRRG